MKYNKLPLAYHNKAMQYDLKNVHKGPLRVQREGQSRANMCPESLASISFAQSGSSLCG